MGASPRAPGRIGRSASVRDACHGRRSVTIDHHGHVVGAASGGRRSSRQRAERRSVPIRRFDSSWNQGDEGGKRDDPQRGHGHAPRRARATPGSSRHRTRQARSLRAPGGSVGLRDGSRPGSRRPIPEHCDPRLPGSHTQHEDRAHGDDGGRPSAHARPNQSRRPTNHAMPTIGVTLVKAASAHTPGCRKPATIMAANMMPRLPATRSSQTGGSTTAASHQYLRTYRRAATCKTSMPITKMGHGTLSSGLIRSAAAGEYRNTPSPVRPSPRSAYGWAGFTSQ